MAVLFLKELLRELEAVKLSANCVQFISPVLDSKFLNNYGADINWQLYNLYLFNTVVLGEEGIHAVFQHGLDYISRHKELNIGILFDEQENISCASEYAQILQAATTRWVSINEVVTEAAMGKSMNPVDEMFSYSTNKNKKELPKIDGDMPGNNLPRPLSCYTEPSWINMSLMQRKIKSKQEFYKSALMTPSAEQRIHLMGEADQYQNDDNSTWVDHDVDSEDEVLWSHSKMSIETKKLEQQMEKRLEQLRIGREFK